MPYVSAVTAVAALGYGIYQGEEQKSQAKKSLRNQATAQRQAESAAISQARKADEATRRANQKQPDPTALLAGAQSRTRAPSLLTGPSGVDPSLLTLGQPKLLGE